MSVNIPEPQKREMLMKELSNVGYGMNDPITLDALTGILNQKSVGQRFI
jgi:hypothetical protein